VSVAEQNALIPDELDPLQLAREVLATEAAALQVVRDRLDESFCRAAVLVHAAAVRRGSVIVTGMGKAGLVGQKIAATLASTGTPAVHAITIETGVDEIMDDDGTAVLLRLTPGEVDGVVTVTPVLLSTGTPVDPVAELHLVKAALANVRVHALATGVDEIRDDDGVTTVRRMTPSESGGVVTIVASE